MHRLRKVVVVPLLYLLFIDCTSGKCSVLNDCNPPNKKIDFEDPNTGCVKRVCTCRGTDNGLSENTDGHGTNERLKKMYTNCTLVDGNLEINSFKIDFEQNGGVINFAKNVEEVKGYVLITKTEKIKKINLSSLRLIKGGGDLIHKGTMVDCKKVEEERKKTALAVMDNADLEELLLPNLIEISEGHVTIEKNPNLCFMDQIEWEKELFNKTGKQRVELKSNKPRNECSSCPDKCFQKSLEKKVCWNSESCQLVTRSSCTSGCKNRCSPTDPLICCDEDCAASCFANGSEGCYLCSDVNVNGRCEKACQKKHTKVDGQVKRNPNALAYNWAYYCLKECPENTVESSNEFCAEFCQEGYYAFDGKHCTNIAQYKESNKEKCAKDGCDHVCQGLFTNQGKGVLKDATHLDGDNIKYFHKSCTVIEGSLLFHGLSFVK